MKSNTHSNDFLNMLAKQKEPKNKQSFKQLTTNGFPSLKTPNWRYTNIDELLQQKLSFSPTKKQTLQWNSLAKTHNEIVFVNGVFEEKFSSFTQQGFSFQELTTFKLSKFSYNPFAELNNTYKTIDYKLTINQKCKLELPFHIVSISTGENSICIPNLTIVGEKNSSTIICESQLGQSNNSLTTTVSQIQIEQNAQMYYYRFIQACENYFFNKICTQVAQDALLETFTFNLGGKISRQEFDINLNGTGACATADGLYTCSKSDKSDNRTTLNHHQPYTTSRQLYKGIASGNSRGIFNTKVFIAQDAQKSDSQQLSKNLILSKNARIDAKPELVAKADDVKAGHGATVGQLNEEEVFYLQSRGISKKQALAIVLDSFINEVFDKIKEPHFKKFIKKQCYEVVLQKADLALCL